jgi:predicted kinase
MSQSEKKLLILRGAPGSGKSTWITGNIAKQYSAEEYVICSADNFFVANGNGTYKFDPRLLGKAHGQCQYLANKAMESGLSLVVIDNTNITPKEYKPYIEMAAKHGYQVFQHVLNGNFNNTHGVPEDKVASMRMRFVTDSTIPPWK